MSNLSIDNSSLIFGTLEIPFNNWSDEVSENVGAIMVDEYGELSSVICCELEGLLISGMEKLICCSVVGFSFCSCVVVLFDRSCFNIERWVVDDIEDESVIVWIGGSANGGGGGGDGDGGGGNCGIDIENGDIDIGIENEVMEEGGDKFAINGDSNCCCGGGIDGGGSCWIGC